MTTIKRFKIWEKDPLTIIDLGWSMEFIEDDLGNFSIAPAHVICRADTPEEALRTMGLLNAVAPLADTLKSVESLASWAMTDLSSNFLWSDNRFKRAIEKVTHWARAGLDPKHRSARRHLERAESIANETLADLQPVIRSAK